MTYLTVHKICFSSNFLCSCNNIVTQNRAAVPKPNEAQSPQEVAERPMEYFRTEVQEKEAFAREGKAAQPIKSNTYVCEITPTKDSFQSKKTNFEDTQGVTKKKKGIISTKLNYILVNVKM